MTPSSPDLPSYGRGPGGEVWKLEDNLFPFVKLCAQVLSDKPLFVIINSYTTGLAPRCSATCLLVAEKYGGKVTWDESTSVTETGLAPAARRAAGIKESAALRR